MGKQRIQLPSDDLAAKFIESSSSKISLPSDDLASQFLIAEKKNPSQSASLRNTELPGATSSSAGKSKGDFISSLSFLDAASYGTGSLLKAGSGKKAEELTPEQKEYARVERVKRDALDEIVRSSAFMPGAPAFMKNTSLAGGVSKLASNAATALGALTEAAVNFADDIVNPKISLAAPSGFGLEGFRQTDFDIAKAKEDYSKPRKKSSESVAGDIYNFGNVLNKLGDSYLRNSARSVGVKEENIGKGFTELIRDGENADAFLNLGVQSFSQLPQVVALASTGGGAAAVFGGSMALGTAASLGEEFDKDGDITASNAIKSIGKGIVEGVTETIFRTDIQAAKQLGRSLFTLSGDATQEGLKALIKQEGKEAVKEALVRDTGQVFKKAFGGAFEEGIEEVLAATGSFVIDRLEDGKWNQKNFEQLLMDASDSFFIGAATGGFISGASARMSMQPLTIEQQKKIEKFNEIANNEELSEDVRNIAKDKVNEIVKFSTDLAEKDYGLLARLPIQQRQEAFDILSKIKTIEAEKSELKDESLLESAEKTIDGYKTQVDSIIGANETRIFEEFRDALKTATEKDNEAVMAFLEENNILEQADQILAPVSQKVANKEDIQDTVVNETTDKLYNLLELIDSSETLTPQQKLIASQPIDEEIAKLEGYEFTAKYDTTETFTKETTRTTREVGRVERENARKTKVTADRFNGQFVRFTDGDGNAINTIAKVDDSGTITLQEQPKLGKPAGKPIVVDSNFLEFQESKLDDDGNVVGAVLLDTSNNSTIQISNPELAMDLAIKAKQDKLGPISDAIFEQAVTEVLTGQELETTKEYINKNRATEAAQQAQTQAEEVEAPQTEVPTSPVGLPSRRAYVVEDDVETKKGNRILNKVNPVTRKRIANYVKALKATVPNSIVVLYDNKLDMIEGLVNQGYSSREAATAVNQSDGLYAGGANTIHIDVMRMDATTLPHEIFHPLVARLAKENPEEFIALRKRITSVLSGNTIKELDAFAKLYAEEGQAVEAEEFLAQLAGLVTNNKAKMERGTLMKLALAAKEFLKKIAAKTNSKALADFANSIFTEQTKTDDLIKFFEGFGRSLRQGEAINTSAINPLSNEEITEQEAEDIDNINEDFSGTLYEPTNLNITGTIDSPVPNTGRQPQLKASKRGGIQVLKHETIDRKDLVGKNYSVTMSDHTKVGEYVNERTGVRIDNLMGGVFYPYIKGVRDAGLAWASVTTKAAREMILNAQNQDFTVVYRMSRSTGSRGNHNFNDVAYEELIAPVKNGSVSEKEFLQQLNDKLNSVSGGKQLVAGKSFLNKYGQESKNKITVKEKNKNGELVDVTSKRKEITSLEQFKDALRKESFGSRGSFWSTLMKDDWNKKSTGTWYKFLEKHNVASIAEIVDGLAEFETDTANDHDVVSVIKLDKPEYDAKGNVKIYTTRQELVNEDKGIYFIDAPNHPSYPYVVKGQPVGLLNEFNPISDYFPIIKEWINSGRLNSPYKAVETMGRELISSRDTLRQQKSRQAINTTYEATPELANIGTQQQYLAYVDTIFPNSKVKDIVYHGTMASENILNNGFKREFGGALYRNLTANSFYFGSNFENSRVNYAFKKDLDNLSLKLQTVYDYFNGDIKSTAELTTELDNLNKESRAIYDRLNYGLDVEFRNRPVFQKILDAIFEFVGIKDSLGNLSDAKQTLKKEYEKLQSKISDIRKSISVSSAYSYGKELYEKRDNSKVNPLNGLYQYADISTQASDRAKQEAFEIIYGAKSKGIKYSPKVLPVILNVQNPLEVDFNYKEGDTNPLLTNQRFSESFISFNKKSSDVYNQFTESNSDGLIERNTFDIDLTDVFIVKNPEQIYVLGSNQDIEGFKSYVKNDLRQKKTYPDALEDSRKAYLAKFKNTPQEVSRYVRKLLFERNINVKKAMQDANLEFSLYTMYNKAGASMFGNLKFTELYNEIYGKLSPEEIKLVDNFVFLRRVVAIDTNFDNRNIARPKHTSIKNIDGAKTTTNKESALAALADYKDLLGTELYDKIYQSSDSYFKAFSNILKYKYDNGLINKETYELYKDYNYSPRKFLEFVFGTSISEEAELSSNNFYQRGLALSKQELASIKDGSNEEIFADSAKLLHAAMIATEVRVASNLALKTLYNEGIPANLDFVKEVQYEKYQDGTIKVNADGSLKYDKTADKGFRIVTFKENGVVKAFQLKESLAKEYFDEELFDRNSKAYKFAQIASGANILRNMATGMNIAFPITNIPVDVISQVQLNNIYDGAGVGVAGQYTKAFAGTIANSVKLIPLEWGVKNKALEDLIYEYGKAGGLMMSMSQEYAAKDKFFGAMAKYLGSFGNASEMASKLTAYKAAKEREIKLFTEKNGTAPTGEDLSKIQTKAAFVARSAMDYHRGGLLTKWLDGFIPYLNVFTQASKITADYIRNNPVAFTNKITQAGIFVMGLTIYNMYAAGDDYDNDDNEQDLATKLVFLFPFKNADGTRGKLEFAAPGPVKAFLNIFQNIGEGIYHQINGEQREIDEWKIKANAKFLNMFSANLATNIPPALKAMVEYSYNLDLWRNKDITSQLGKVLPQDEGRFDKNVAEFYKIIGSATGKSPIRMQKATENFLTQSNPLVGLGYALMDKSINAFTNMPESQRSKFDKGQISDIPVAFLDKVAGRVYSVTDPKVTFAKANEIIDKINQTAGSKKQELKAEIKMLVEKNAPAAELNKFLTTQDPMYRLAALEYKEMLRNQNSLNFPNNKGEYFDVMTAENAEAKAQILYAHFPYLLDKGNEKLQADLVRLKLYSGNTMVYFNKYVKDKGVK